ncbi:cell division initiation protein [Streptomyces sp. NPDC057638]|uniref:cell division initiation protein n=1 Tax=Streptomyces sp. NPDC057638 TaxID=3346190 RepID=UPI00369E6E94
MDVQKKLDEIVAAVGGARSMPMSASCVVNRAELLDMLGEVRQALPGSLAQAQELIGGRERLVAAARQEAERIIEGAHAERGSLVSDTQVARQSQDEADRILADARREAERIRAEADEYVDSQLANFEVVLAKTIGSVERGREKLLGRGPGLDADGLPDADAPEYSPDPATLVHRADGYVEAKLGAFEAVLAKTLEAVGRGRSKLQGATDDALGDHMAAQDAAGATGRRHTTDAEYLAGLAELADPEPSRNPADAARTPAPAPERAAPVAPGPVPSVSPSPLDQGGAQQHGYPMPEPVPDPFAGYQQQGYAAYQQDPYAGYPQEPMPHQHGHQHHGQHQPSYPSPVDHQGGYPAQPQGYDPYAAPAAPEAYGYQPARAERPQQGAPALDETSFFDTGMIDLEQLRRYEQGR